MVRYKRIYYHNAVYHITFRGNNRQPILKENKDKELFLETLSKFKERFQFKLYGFVLMDNHAHLVIETNHLFNISKIMQSILLSYSLQFRRKYNYTGHVWQGRFKSNVIEGERYILQCIEYIHNNPVRANIATTAEDYLWSSFYLYSGNENSIVTDRIGIDRYGDISDTTL
ncbi:MAG: transposase [Candidatus Omnitrophota bacterium]